MDMRKSIFGLVVMLAGAAVMADEDRFANASPRERTTWQLAVHTAARRALEAAEGLQDPEADRLSLMQSTLTATVLADAQSHGRRADSLVHCREAVRGLLRAALDERMALILDVANEQSPLPVQAADVQQLAGVRYEQSVAAALAAFEKTRFDALFEKVRSQAVALERQAVDRRVSPPPFDKLDALLTGLADARGFLDADWLEAALKHLRGDLQSYAGRKDGPVLEEVATYAEGVANRMAEGVRQQYGRQLALADRLFADDTAQQARLAAELETQVLDALDAGLAGLSPEDATTGVPLPVYPVFATAKAYVRQKAETIEAERFAGFLGETPLLDVDAGYLMKTIQSDLAAHRTREAGRRLLLSGLATSRRPLVAAAYTGKDAGNATTTHFSTLLEGESPPAAVFKSRLADGLDALLPVVRGTLADAQYAAAGLTTLDALDILPDVLVSEVHVTRGALPQTLVVALAFLERGGISGAAGGVLPDGLLEETAARALARVNALVAAADRAINGQLDLLRGLESERLDALKADVAAGRPQEEIREEWEQALRQRWGTLAATQESPYAALTPPALEALNKTLRQLYDSLLQEHMEDIENLLVQQAEDTVVPEVADPAAADAVESEPPPEAEETTIPPPESAAEVEEKPEADAGGGASSGGEMEGAAERPMPDILLVLSGDAADRCEAVLTIAGERIRFDQALEVADPQASADVLFARMEPFLAALRENAVTRSRESRGLFGLRRRAAQPSISVHVVVESNAVRHRMSLLLKRRIEDAITRQQTGSGTDAPAVAIDWQAGLTE